MGSNANQRHRGIYHLFWGLLVMTMTYHCGLLEIKQREWEISISLYLYLHLYLCIFFSSYFHTQEWSSWTIKRSVPMECITKRKLKKSCCSLWPWTSYLFLMSGKEIWSESSGETGVEPIYYFVWNSWDNPSVHSSRLIYKVVKILGKCLGVFMPGSHSLSLYFSVIQMGFILGNWKKY